MFKKRQRNILKSGRRKESISNNLTGGRYLIQEGQQIFFHINTTTAPSNASNPELTTARPAPLVDALPAAVPVLEEAFVPVLEPLVADACKRW
jgi:hypothetical protein